MCSCSPHSAMKPTMHSMKRVLLAMLVLCVACVGAMKLPSQLQAINPKAKVHAAIQVGL